MTLSNSISVRTWPYLWLLLIAASVSVVAQDLSELLLNTPSCALPCVIEGTQAANCDLLQLGNCICPNITLQADLSTCVQKSCDFANQVRIANVQNVLCEAYPKESRSREVTLVAIILSGIGFPIVALRCYARWSTTKKLWWDDWAALFATACLAALAGIEIASGGKGFGQHYWNISVSDGTSLLQMFYVVQMLYILIQVFAKVSILLLYHRVFPRRWFKLTTTAFMIFLVTHGFAFLVVIIAQCLPISSIWDRNIRGKCVDLNAVGYTGAVFSIIEDLAILVLPISELNALSLGMKKRLALILMFSVGSFACVTSMVRLKYLVSFSNSFDSTWDNVDVVIWSMIEEFSAVICVCLPPLRPLLVQYLPSLFASLTSKSNKSNSKDSSYRMKSWKPALGKQGKFHGLDGDVEGLKATDGNGFRSDEERLATNA